MTISTHLPLCSIDWTNFSVSFLYFPDSKFRPEVSHTRTNDGIGQRIFVLKEPFLITSIISLFLSETLGNQIFVEHIMFIF